MSEDEMKAATPVEATPKKPRAKKAAAASSDGAPKAARPKRTPSSPQPGDSQPFNAGAAVPAPEASAASAPVAATGTALAVTASPTSDTGALGAAAAKVNAMIPENVTDKAREVATEVKDMASDAVHGLARIISDSAGAIDDNVGPKYGDYARTAAQSVSDAADRLRAKPVDEIAEDTREFVRTKPAAAVGIAAVLSLMLAKIFGSVFGSKKR
ncbi:hypothetical protein [Blastomonas sp.]|uniref:hypothetical protein n=1 Tax=Blastomonas sp. TaxID=1909299 RepID=UPI002619E11F|nr:hypothetical protein [Blastomonas sp.]MDM7955629.1 hypothetical protein [Blastomonas sp.]